MEKPRPRAMCMKRRLLLAVCGAPLALAACEEAPSALVDAAAVDAAPVDAAPMYPSPACEGPDEAPLRAADGGHVCTRVGAATDEAPGPWPDAADLPLPRVYVRPGADGDGTMERPYGDLAAALAATPPPATVLLARGTYTLSATLALTRSVTLRGAGAGATVFEAPAGDVAVRVRGAITASLSRLTVRAPAAVAGGFGAVSVEGGATCLLRDVTVEGGGDGVRADGASTLCAEGLSVRDAGQHGVTLRAGSAGFLRGFSVRGSGGVGVLVDRAHLTAERGLVADNARDGVALRGARLGALCGDDGACAAPAPCAGFSWVTSCAAGLGSARMCRSADALTDVAVLRNHATGVRASRATPSADEVAAGARDVVLGWPGPDVRVSRIVVADTRAPTGAPGGDGLYVGAAATVTLDPDTSSDAARGLVSELVGNARTGVLVDGDRSGRDVPDGLRRAGRLDLAGARVASNRGPGVFVQERALATRIAYTEVADNGALGVGATAGGGVSLMICDRFVATRAARIVPEDTAVRPFVAGDGVSLAQGGTGPRLRVMDSEFSQNARFGLVLDGYDATLDDGVHGGNRGAGNAFGLGVYGVTRLDGTTPRSAIQGVMATIPTTAPTVRDSVPEAASAL